MGQILIIDDDPNVRSVLGRMLQRAGHEFIEAGDSAAGMELLRRRRVDLVIIDIYMPGLGGLATIPLLRKQWPALKIIAISGVERAGPVRTGARAVEAGADHFLQKPFETQDLLGTIRTLLAEPSPPQ